MAAISSYIFNNISQQGGVYEVVMSVAGTGSPEVLDKDGKVVTPAVEAEYVTVYRDALVKEGDGNKWTYNGIEVQGYTEESLTAEQKDELANYKVPGSPDGVAPDGVHRLYGNDLKSRSYVVGETIYGDGDPPKVKTPGEKMDLGKAPKSQFNDWSLIKYRNIPGLSSAYKDDISNFYQTAVFDYSILDPSANNIIQFANSIESKSFNYKLADFIQCKYYGQISNDYMITLRRFAYPVPDDIIDTKQFHKGKMMDTTQPDLARAITWMSPAIGNDIKEMLKFSVKFKWTEAEAALQTIQASSSTGNKRGALGAWLDGNSVLSGIEAGLNGYSADKAARANMYQGGGDPYGDTYPNHVYGPLNVIKKTLNRDQGLEFEQEFSIKFHYDLKAYYGVSPKVAFMDTLANLLTLTYNNAPFWGGATRYTGGGSGNTTGKPFGDYSKLASGDYMGFAKSLMSDIGDKLKGLGDAANALVGAAGKALAGDFEGAAGALAGNNVLDNIIGGGLMKMLGGPTGASGGQAANALLTGDPSGQWHLTIGNPMSPICVIGNLALEKSDFEFVGPVGLEGFPTELTMTCSLKPARPRDKGDIESMFNAGRGRIYLQPDIEGARNLDEIYDVSRYGNKDLRKKSGRVLFDRISNFAND